ncbi:MAG: hypothetical protein RI885_1814 [Actinomycetota bacterium]|jgi:uncharacterized membrane protein
MRGATPRRDARGLGLFLLLAGGLGFVAAFALTLDKLQVLEDPTTALGCDFSLIVQCGANLSSAQGELFGFPNPLLGIVGFTAVVAVGTALVAGAVFADWFWALFGIGLVAAQVFVVWLIAQSIFVLGTLCPWCMLVWAVTIPLFLVVTLRNAASGILRMPGGVRRASRRLLGWVLSLTLGCYLIVAVIAQLRLDVLGYL